MDKIKYVGMYIDKYLSWNYHIQHLSTKLSRAKGFLVNKATTATSGNRPCNNCALFIKMIIHNGYSEKQYSTCPYLLPQGLAISARDLLELGG